MCKPQVGSLRLHSDGPCNFEVRSYHDACAAFSLGETWRIKLANTLRRWADKAQGVQSLTITAYGPPSMTFSDVLDGTTVGINGATKYLNDLWRDRVHGSSDTTAAVIKPTKAIG